MAAPHAPLVLVVDDSVLVTEALGILLDASGYRSVAATSLAEARGVLAVETPDLVLLDLTLPDGDGLELHIEAGASAVLPPTIALTGHDDEETVRRCVDAGCVAVLTKPVRAAALLAVLRDAGVEPVRDR